MHASPRISSSRITAHLHATLSRPIPEEGIDYLSIVYGVERALIEKTLVHAGGNVLQAALLLNIKRDRLRYRIKLLKIRYRRVRVGRPQQTA